MQIGKNERSSRRKYIENYDNNILMRIPFVLEFYVYKRR